MQRRELFSSLATSLKKKQQEFIIRPPYYKNADSFYKGCLTCENECASFCEENIIVILQDKTPHLDFKKGGCTYCDECALKCPNGVLKVEYKTQSDAKIEIDVLKCMSWHQNICFSCKDPCLENAIEFLGMFRPSINQDICTNCGFCVSVCPSEAVVINRKES